MYLPCDIRGRSVADALGFVGWGIMRMDNRGGMDVSEEPKAMVQRLVEGINVGNIEGIVDELFAPRVRRRAKRLFTEFYTAFPDWREEIVELVAEANTVAGRFRCSGTHQGEFLGEPPTGKRMEVDEVFFLRVEDGKFVDFWGLEDSLNRMRQLGLLPSPNRSE
jgi:predicted ester cyclase